MNQLLHSRGFQFISNHKATSLRNQTMATRQLSQIFRSIKPHKNPNRPKLLANSKQQQGSSHPSLSSPSPTPSCSSAPKSLRLSKKMKNKRSWCAYLILSTNPPIKTYVGVTTDFPRRLKQHNGELKGGAKASRAGRPWICACLVEGFVDRSEACEFESKWKFFSRNLPRKRRVNDLELERQEEGEVSVLLLQHRHAALKRVKHSCQCDHLEIYWQSQPSE